jgi:hypothetical protein
MLPLPVADGVPVIKPAELIDIHEGFPLVMLHEYVPLPPAARI